MFNFLINTNSCANFCYGNHHPLCDRLLEVPSAVAFLFYDAWSNILDDRKLEVENAIYASAPDSGKKFN